MASALPFICGYLNLDDYTYFDVEKPAQPPMSAYGGNINNSPNCKVKMDYHRNLWFFAVDNPSSPTIMYLVRATRNIDDSVTLAYKQIPLVAATFLCQPNQITIDKNDNVFFPTGYINSEDAHYYVMKVTNTQDPNPANWVYDGGDWHAYDVDPNPVGSFGISLSKNHGTLVTYVPSILGGDILAVINTTTMAVATEKVLATSGNANIPNNIETDVSGLGNDNWAFIIIDIGAGNKAMIALNMTNPAGAYVTNVLTSQFEGSISIKTTGEIVTGDQQNCNEYIYPVVGAGVVGVGVINASGGLSPMNFDDLVRSAPAALLNVRYWAHGYLSGVNAGQVREVNDAVQASRVAVANYQYYSTAAEREAHT